jgi:hypothetical protein
MLDRRTAIFAVPAAGALIAAAAACSRQTGDIDDTDNDRDTNPDLLGSVTVNLIAPPFVHAHEQVARGAPEVVNSG